MGFQQHPFASQPVWSTPEKAQSILSCFSQMKFLKLDSKLDWYLQIQFLSLGFRYPKPHPIAKTIVR
jgi:hypothetical protein